MQLQKQAILPSERCLPSNQHRIQSRGDKQQGPNKQKTYIVISQPTFKERLRNHNKSFKHKKYEKETELSKYIWQLKEAKTKFSIKWSILRRTSGYNNVTKSCNLCTSEKLSICNFKDKANLINKRNELISKCRHENRYVLNNFTCSHENG